MSFVQENVIWGQRSNMMSVATDCDQRDERLAWQGDAGLSADSMALNFHTPAFQNNIAVNNHDELVNQCGGMWLRMAVGWWFGCSPPHICTN